MSAAPWMKFYPADWRADQALRVCSLAARGLWMEMLCVMHNAEQYGHLLLNGRPVTDAQLAMLAGTTPDQIPVLLGELEAAAVFSRTQKGVIYSRRMTRDHKWSNEGRKAVKKRWDAERAKSVPDQTFEKPAKISRPNRPPKRPPTTQKPESRDSPYSPPRGDADGFNRFREAYPSRGGAPDPDDPIRSAYDRQVEAGTDPEVLITAAKSYAAYCRKHRTEPRFVKSAANFLQQGIWQQYTGKSRSPERSDAEWRTNRNCPGTPTH
jgi:hypothetical protein